MNRTERLKPILQDLDPSHYSQLRDAYYKAAEGLAALETLLGKASDLHSGLAGELNQVQSARQQFDRCGLGGVL